MSRYQGGGVMVGLLDTFRALHSHLINTVDLVARHGIGQIRLVDTAGTCLPHQVQGFVGELVERFPAIRFYGIFMMISAWLPPMPCWGCPSGCRASMYRWVALPTAQVIHPWLKSLLP
ncbi:hypothetical protein QNM99_15850 [Pseudomonas sp. PCH446]